MNREEQLDAIRKVCIAANPSKEWERESYHEDGSACSFELPLTLADVLVAIDSSPGNYIIGENARLTIANWNLREDNLNRQSNECIEFIFTLLCV